MSESEVFDMGITVGATEVEILSGELFRTPWASNFSFLQPVYELRRSKLENVAAVAILAGDTDLLPPMSSQGDLCFTEVRQFTTLDPLQSLFELAADFAAFGGHSACSPY
jgi:hypothetical protein